MPTTTATPICFGLRAAQALEAADRPGWTGQLWSGIASTYATILEHPFILGLTSGDLAPEAFYYADGTQYDQRVGNGPAAREARTCGGTEGAARAIAR